MAKHNEVGRWGEDIACGRLVRQGYAIAERNWRMGHYEIDIIAIKGSRIVFVEVKTRTNADEDPFDAIDKKKIHHMITSANVYLRESQTRLEPQFDLIGITGTPENYNLEHIEDAFLPPLKTYY